MNHGTERHDKAVPALHAPGRQGNEARTDPGQTTTFALRFDVPGTHGYGSPNPGKAAVGMTDAIVVSP